MGTRGDWGRGETGDEGRLGMRGEWGCEGRLGMQRLRPIIAVVV